MNEKRRVFVKFSSFALVVICLVAVLAKPAFAQSNLTHGHQVLLDKGLQIGGFVQIYDYSWSGDYVKFNQSLWEQSGFSSITIISGALYKYQVARGLPGGEDAYNWNTWASSGNENYTASDPVYSPNLVAIQYGDEQSIGSSNLASQAAAVANLKANNPNSIVYLNQGLSASGYSVTNGITQSMLNTYTQTVKPDMLHFTEYPFRWQGTNYVHDYEGGSPTSMYVHMEMYRKAGLAGLDGTGSQPIPVGMYTQTYVDSRSALNHRVPTESELRLQQFAGWAFGMKYNQAYVYTDNSTSIVSGIFFNETGTAPNLVLEPTESFYQYAELNRQSTNLGDALVKLISTDVRMKMGKREDGVSNPLPVNSAASVEVQAWDSTADEYLKNVSAVNLGNKNNGKEGDVVVGFFKPLDASLVEEGAEDDVYFMIVNGLTDETGDAEDCRQQIRLDFDFTGTDITQLLRVSRDSGEIEVVSLINDGNSLYHLDLILDGGTGDLFKYDTGTAFVPEPVSLSIFLTGFVMFSVKRKLLYK